MSRLVTEQLKLSAGKKLLIDDLSIEFEAGQNWAVLGPNGSGKTTLLHCLAGLRPADNGTVMLDGQALTSIASRKRARHIGIVFQHYDDAFPSNVIDTVMAGRHPHLNTNLFAVETAADEQFVQDALQKMELDPLAHRALNTLSGGERRRVDIAMLLAQQPTVRLLDEPCNHLDLRHQGSILHQLTSMEQKQAGNRLTNVIALHDINQAIFYCDHALLLYADGRTVHGPTEEVINRNALEELYECKLAEIGDHRRKLFLPETTQ